MKKILSSALAVVLLAATFFINGTHSYISAESENLITNGGFEDSNKGWTWVDTKESSSKYVTEEKGYESTHSMRLKDGEGGGKGDYCYQEFSVEKNTDYIVSFKAYFEKLDTKKQTQWGIISGSGNTFDTDVTLFVETLQDTTGNTSFDWVAKAHSFNSGDNDKLRLVFRTYTGTLGYVDNVSVVKVAETDNLIKDGGFEYGKLYWGTDYNNINSISDKWVGNYFKTGEGLTGSSATVEKGYNKYIFTEFECTPDTDYEVSFCSKLASGINCAVLPTFDATNQTKITDDYVNQNGLGSIYSNDSADWKENTLIFNSGNHSKLSVVFYNRWGGNTDNRFDDVSVIKNTVPATPAAPEIESQTVSSVTLKSVEGMEYSMDGVNYFTSPVFTGLFGGKEYSFYQRVAASGDNLPSEKSEAVTCTLTVNGDTDSNGTINATDIANLRKVLLGALTDYSFDGCDANGDKALDIRDLVSAKKTADMLAVTNFVLTGNKITDYVIVYSGENTTVSSAIAEFNSAVKSRVNAELTIATEETASKPMIKVLIDEENCSETYKINISGNAVTFTAGNEELLAKAFNIFAERINDYSADMPLIITQAYSMSGI